MQSPKSLGDICYEQDGGAHTYFFHTPERVRPYGAGLRGVVLANDVPHSICEETGPARFLARNGFHVVIFASRPR